MIDGMYIDRSHTAQGGTNTRGFFLGKNTSRNTPLYCNKAHVSMAPYSSFLDLLKVTGPGAAVYMGIHTYIQELRLPDGGDIYFEGTNHQIVKLIAHGGNSQKLVLHVRPNIDWRKFVIKTDIGADIIVQEDIVVE